MAWSTLEIAIGGSRRFKPRRTYGQVHFFTLLIKQQSNWTRYELESKSVYRSKIRLNNTCRLWASFLSVCLSVAAWTTKKSDNFVFGSEVLLHGFLLIKNRAWFFSECGDGKITDPFKSYSCAQFRTRTDEYKKCALIQFVGHDFCCSCVESSTHIKRESGKKS